MNPVDVESSIYINSNKGNNKKKKNLRFEVTDHGYMLLVILTVK